MPTNFQAAKYTLMKQILRWFFAINQWLHWYIAEIVGEKLSYGRQSRLLSHLINGTLDWRVTPDSQGQLIDLLQTRCKCERVTSTSLVPTQSLSTHLAESEVPDIQHAAGTSDGGLCSKLLDSITSGIKSVSSIS